MSRRGEAYTGLILRGRWRYNGGSVPNHSYFPGLVVFVGLVVIAGSEAFGI